MCTNLLLDIIVTLAVLLRSHYRRLSGGIHAALVSVVQHQTLYDSRILIEVQIRRSLFVCCKAADASHSFLGLRPDSIELTILSNACVYDGLAEGDDRILCLPSLDLLFGTVCILVGGRMSKQTVGNHIQEYRTFAALNKRKLSSVCVDNSQRVIAVYTLCMQLALGYACTHTCKLAVTHGLTTGLTAHTIGVIVDVEDQRQAALSSLFPQRTVLIHGSEGKCLPYGAASHGAVAQVGYYDAVLVVTFLEQGCSCRDGCGTAYQCIVRVDTKGQEERMHGAAQSLVKTIFTGKQLCQGAVYQELDSQLFYIAVCFADSLNGLQSLAVEEILHGVHQLFVIQLLDTGQTFCQNLTVASVASEGEVLFAQQISLADCGCLLSQGQMGRTRISCLNVRIFRLSLDLVQHILELTADAHIAVDTEQVFLGIVAFLYFFLYTLFVYIDRDVFKCDFSFRTHFVRIYI